MNDVLEGRKEWLRSCMDDALESINAEGQIKRVEINDNTKEVSFIFDLMEIDGLDSFIDY